MDAFQQEIQGFEQRRLNCVPVPKLWNAFHAKYQIEWTSVPFDVGSRPQIPQESGFYCFFIGLPPPTLPPVGYPVYVGKTERTLRVRFNEYLREQKDAKGRIRARKFLGIFEGELTFAFTAFNGTSAQIKEIETALHDALQPSYSDVGFSAEIRERRQAFQ